MSIFIPISKASLLIPDTGPKQDPTRSHLFFILTDMCPDKKNLLVPVCTVTGFHDRTCVLEPGDHRFFNKRSYVQYSNTKTYKSATLAKRVSEGAIQYFGMVDDLVFKRVCEGLTSSPHSPPWAKKYFSENAP